MNEKTAHEEEQHQHHQRHHHHTYDPEMRNTDWEHFWDRQREREPQARQWLQVLSLQPGDRFLDVGSGPGFISLMAAESVGEKGQVIALDRLEEALAVLRRRMKELGRDNVIPVRAPGDHVPVDDQEVDAALMANMLHHNKQPEQILSEVYRTLKPGGRLLVVEFDPDGDPEVGPPVSERLSMNQVQDFLADTGFGELQAGESRPHWYYVRAVRR